MLKKNTVKLILFHAVMDLRGQPPRNMLLIGEL